MRQTKQSDVWLLFSARSWDDVHMYIYICIIHTYIYILYTKNIYSIYIYKYVVKPASWRTFSERQMEGIPILTPGFFRRLKRGEDCDPSWRMGSHDL